jgi:hypothetical protein
MAAIITAKSTFRSPTFSTATPVSDSYLNLLGYVAPPAGAGSPWFRLTRWNPEFLCVSKSDRKGHNHEAERRIVKPVKSVTLTACLIHNDAMHVKRINISRRCGWVPWKGRLVLIPNLAGPYRIRKCEKE